MHTVNQTLASQGLGAFGVDVEQATARLSTFAARHTAGQAAGAAAVSFCLTSLLQKMEATCDGRSAVFRLDDDEVAILDILLEAGTHFKVRRKDSTVVRA